MRIIVILLIIAYSVHRVMRGPCRKIRIRRNIKSLSSSEWSSLVNAFTELIVRGTVERFADMHVKSFPYIHDNKQFLPWHRYFQLDFEAQLRLINPKIILPYWDSAADFEAPHLSEILSPGYFGGNGDPKSDYCVRDGFQSKFYVLYPSAHCLRRDYVGFPPGTIAPWQSPAFITFLIQTVSSYDEFYQYLETSLHNFVHAFIGGLRGDFVMQYSAVDFLFWVHHANADRIWAKWQASDPSHRNAIGGLQLNRDGTYQQLTVDSMMEHYRIPVREVLDTSVKPYCYTYDDIALPNESVAKLAVQKLQLLPETQLKRYFPKVLDGSVKALDLDFGDVESLEATLGKPLPNPTPMPLGFYERMNFNKTKGQIIEKLCQDFVNDINLGLFLMEILDKSDQEAISDKVSDEEASSGKGDQETGLNRADQKATSIDDFQYQGD